MKGFEPSEREKQQVFKHLPRSKNDLIELIKLESRLDEKYARSLIWNMHYRGQIYTFDGLIMKV